MKNLLYIFGMLIVFASCNQSKKTNQVDPISDIKFETTDEIDSINIEDGIPIYYNMYLTVEITSFFENEGAIFNEDILNSVTNVNEYITSSEKAMNLGVYAADLSYTRVFEQYQKAGSYFSAMYKLAEELGIPEDYIYSSADRIDKNLTNKDSLRAIADEVYSSTKEYLVANERESASALIVFGGWVETIYLASEVFDMDADSSDYEYMLRIEEQKISLQNIIDLLTSYKEDPVIADMLAELKDLKPIYDKFEVDEDDLRASLSQLALINAKIEEIRLQIIK